MSSPANSTTAVGNQIVTRVVPDPTRSRSVRHWSSPKPLNLSLTPPATNLDHHSRPTSHPLRNFTPSPTAPQWWHNATRGKGDNRRRKGRRKEIVWDSTNMNHWKIQGLSFLSKYRQDSCPLLVWNSPTEPNLNQKANELTFLFKNTLSNSWRASSKALSHMWACWWG